MTSKKAVAAGSAGLRCGVLFELEGVCLDGHRVLHDVMRAVLSDHGVKMSEVQFARYGLKGVEGLGGLLKAAGKGTVDVQALQTSISAALESTLRETGATPAPIVLKLIQAVRARGAAVGCVSTLPLAVAKAVVEKVGLGEQMGAVASLADSRIPADAWARAARDLGMPARACVAVGASARTKLAAMMAGARFVAVPTRYTTHDDFGGALYCFESGLDDAAVDALVALVGTV